MSEHWALRQDNLGYYYGRVKENTGGDKRTGMRERVKFSRNSAQIPEQTSAKCEHDD